ncbi:uncharacterized protein LOC126159433 [Schistocerca cancellata]|uniref:uncharacterized protein LOC126159433 n=1 Tax=Schistocerca cancellata TaxID=274614 RepID=UPI002119A8D0|nr:uncharacterized protein LOC126159433 [Schistocerca cancellata]
MRGRGYSMLLLVGTPAYSRILRLLQRVLRDAVVRESVRSGSLNLSREELGKTKYLLLMNDCHLEKARMVSTKENLKVSQQDTHYNARLKSSVASASPSTSLSSQQSEPAAVV